MRGFVNFSILFSGFYHFLLRFCLSCFIWFNQSFYRNYDFVNKMKEDEVKKLKEELQEETQPRRIEKIKYLIQRMVTFASIQRITIYLQV